MGHSNCAFSRVVFTLLAGLLVMVTNRRASAAILTYTESGTGNVTLDGNSYNGTPFALTTTANTSGITDYSGIYVIISPTTLSIAGVTPTTFTDNVQVVSNTTNELAGFGDLTTGRAILFTSTSLVGSYGLSTPFGPISGSPVANTGSSFNTTAGLFAMNSVSSVSFQVTAVPEPASLGLIGLAGVGLLCRRKRA